MTTTSKIPFATDFKSALDFAKKRNVLLPRVYYGELPPLLRAKAFTVSGLSSIGQISNVLDSLNKAFEEHISFQDWRQAAIQDAGMAALPGGRLEIIFRTHMQTAYNGGRWQQIKDTADTLPYLMFYNPNDARTTPVCASHAGLIRPVSDTIWEAINPPLHFGCRSTLISISESQAKARSPKGLGLDKPTPADKPEEGWGYPAVSALAETVLSSVVREAIAALPAVIRQQAGPLLASWAEYAGNAQQIRRLVNEYERRFGDWPPPDALPDDPEEIQRVLQRAINEGHQIE